MAKFHRSRLDRIEQKLRPVKREHLDMSKLHDFLLALTHAPEGDREAEELDLINELRRVFEISDECSDHEIALYFHVRKEAS